MRLQKDKIIDLWKSVESVLEKYPSLFPAEFVDIGLFLTVIGQIESRAFGIGGKTLVPLADNMNHNGKLITEADTISKSKQLQGVKNIEYFSID